MVLPGVGTFPSAVKNLKKNNIFKKIKKIIEKGKPTLGICLGMQLLANHSEEIEKTSGLSIIPGKIQYNELNQTHVGWYKIDVKNKQGSI